MHSIAHLVHDYGLVVVAVVIGLESLGLPFPGETVLILAGIYCRHQARSQHRLGDHRPRRRAAIAGQMLGFVIGREFGYRLLLRYGALCADHRRPHQARRISVPPPRQQDHRHRPLRAVAAQPCRHPGRRQPHAVAAVPAANIVGAFAWAACSVSPPTCWATRSSTSPGRWSSSSALPPWWRWRSAPISSAGTRRSWSAEAERALAGTAQSKADSHRRPAAGTFRLRLSRRY